MPSAIVPDSSPPPCDLTAQDIEALNDQMAAYHAHVAPAFARTTQAEWAEHSVRGLLRPCTRTSIEPIALHVGLPIRPLPHFIGQSPWRTASSFTFDFPGSFPDPETNHHTEKRWPMYASLDRIDVVARRPDGRLEYVQTDHRTPEEIDREPELSVLFPLVRMLNPVRTTTPDDAPLMIYAASHPPPPFLRQAIAAAGGHLTVAGVAQPEPEADGTPDLDELLQHTFLALARVVALEHRVELTLMGMQALEADLAQQNLDPAVNEVAYWRAVLRLGAFAGEVIRVFNGGHWVIAPLGTLPFALATTARGAASTVNPLGKAIKLFANGEIDSVAGLVDALVHQS